MILTTAPTEIVLKLSTGMPIIVKRFIPSAIRKNKQTKKNIKDIFNKIMRDKLYYIYLESFEEEFPMYFRMWVEFLDSREQKLPWNTINAYYHVFELSYDGEIKEYSEYF